jgi:type IV pilus assembly protein PilM
LFFTDKKVIGLDIGTSSIKMAEMNISRNNIQLVNFGYTPMPLGCVQSGELTKTNEISAAISNLVKDLKTKRKNVSVGLWGTAVIIKKITIPRMDNRMIADQIRWEAEQYIPFDINEISLSYHILKNSANPETMDILLVAAQNALVQQYQSIVENAGLSAQIMDVSGLALANLYETNYGSGLGECVGILNIGAGLTNFVVVYDGDVVFCRDIPVGGLTFTNEIHKELGITVQEAEAMKLSSVHGKEVPEEVQQVILTTSEAVIEEIRNSFDFFAASGSGVQLQTCYYTGGGSQMPGLTLGLSKMAGVSFEQFNPFSRVRNGAKHLSHEYLSEMSPYVSVAMGLALRKSGDE